jgi:uncharacterized protein involved in exopolysaccharide biosynthesis
MELRFYFTLFLRRLHWFLIVSVLFSAVGIGLAWVLPTVYVAQATLVVESEQIPDSLAASTVQTQATEQLQIIQQRILTRDTLVDMANRLQIYAPLPGQAPKQMDADTLVEDLRKRIKIVTTGGTVPRGPVQATLVTVSFEAPTAALAAAVTNDVVTLILKEDVEMRTGSARQTLEFFQQEVTRLDQELSKRSTAILQFKEANQNTMPDSLEFRRSQLTAGQQQLLILQQKMAELEDTRTRMVRVHEAAGAADTTPVAQQTPEQQQLRGLQDQMNAQLAVLSPENPKIKLMQSQIDALQKLVDAQTQTGLVDTSGQQVSAYDVQLADLDGQMDRLNDQKAQIEDGMKTLQTSIEATPANAITLDTMQRDYDNVQTQYNQAVANRARAETGDTIEAMSKGQRISVIEQAVAPTDPARPNRKLIAAGGVGGGLAAGLALVALIEFLQAGIRRPADITGKLGIAVFATLPYMRTDRQNRWRLLWQLLIVMAVLGGIVATLWAINTYYMPLDLLVDKFVKRLSLLIGQAGPVA